MASIKGTQTEKNLLKAFAIFIYFVILDNLDFLREAVFFLNTPLLAALSIALYAIERSFLASSFFFSLTSFSILFTDSLTAFLLRSFLAFFTSEPRNAFFADVVIGIFI